MNALEKMQAAARGLESLGHMDPPGTKAAQIDLVQTYALVSIAESLAVLAAAAPNPLDVP